jgi:hypothetical protein
MTMIAILVTVMAISSTIPIAQRHAAFESDRRLVAVAMAHQYEYILGAVALLVIAVITWKSKPQRISTNPEERSPALEPATGPVLNGKSSPPTR